MNHFSFSLARALRATPFLAALLTAGCADLAGIGGSSKFGCKAPEGAHCDSVSGNYFNSVANNLPSQRSAGAVATAPEQRDQTRTGLPLSNPEAGVFAPASLRINAKVLRLWIKPWEDADRDLVDQSYVYLQVDRGSWLIDHVQARARDPYAPVRAPEPDETAPARESGATPAGAGAPPAGPVPAPTGAPVAAVSDAADGAVR